METITEWRAQELKDRLDKNDTSLVVVDTRPVDYYLQEHIPGAINVPTDEVEFRTKEALKDKTVVCYGDGASQAALTLAQEGYTVKELTGGFVEWKRIGFPVEKDRFPIEKEPGTQRAAFSMPLKRGFLKRLFKLTR